MKRPVTLIRQGLRFGLVGVFSNIATYVAYLFLVAYGFDHKISMSIMFLIGIVLTFSLNMRWSFSRQEFVRKSFVRYVLAYCAAYFINLATLLLFVDYFALSPKITQAVAIVLIAIMLFIVQKLWVFSSEIH